MSEEPQQLTQDTPLKKERSPAQIEALNRARLKAAEVRASNKDLRIKQREIDKNAMEAIKKQKVERIEQQYSALKQAKEPSVDEPPEEDVEEEIVYQKKEKKPKKKRIVVVQQSSESEDEQEVEVRIPKKKTKAREESPEMTEADRLYQKAYSKMFGLY